MSAAASTAPPWEPDGSAAPPYGNLTFYSANGNQVTSGTNLSNPFDYVVAITAADSGATKATISFYDPATDEAPSSWTGFSGAGPTTFSPASSLPSGTPADIVAYAPTYPVVASSAASITNYIGSAENCGGVTTPACTLSNGYANTIEVRLTDSGPFGKGNAPGTYWESDIGYNTTSSPITLDGTTVPADGWAQLFPLVSSSTTKLKASPKSPQKSGKKVTLKATVKPSTAAGVVLFYDGTTLLGSPVTVKSGKAAMSIKPAVGSHSFTADFVPNLGDETGANTATATIIGGSTSSAVSYTITS